MKGYRTIAVTFVMATLSLLAAFGVEMNEQQSAAVKDFLLAAWPVVVVLMRFFTDTKIGEKE